MCRKVAMKNIAQGVRQVGKFNLPIPLMAGIAAGQSLLFTHIPRTSLSAISDRSLRRVSRLTRRGSRSKPRGQTNSREHRQRILRWETVTQ